MGSDSIPARYSGHATSSNRQDCAIACQRARARAPARCKRDPAVEAALSAWLGRQQQGHWERATRRTAAAHALAPPRRPTGRPLPITTHLYLWSNGPWTVRAQRLLVGCTHACNRVLYGVCLTLFVLRNPLPHTRLRPVSPSCRAYAACCCCSVRSPRGHPPPLFSTSGWNRTPFIMANSSADPAPTTSARPASARPTPVSPAAATPAPVQRAAPTPCPTRPAAATPAHAGPDPTQPGPDRPATDPPASTKPPSISKLAADLACKLHARSTLRRPITQAGVRRIVRIMTLLQALTADYPNFSWHVHVSGHDIKGDVFWLPVFEDKQVLKSSAKRVLDMVYRFVESGSAMLSGAAFELPKSHGARRRRAATSDPRRGLDDGEASAGGSRRARSLGGEERRRSMYDPTSASDLRDGTFVRSDSGAAVQRASPSTALPTTPDEGHGPGEEDAEARAAAAAAAVVDDATEDEGDDDDELADAIIRAAVAGRTPISFLTDGTLTPAATTAAAPGAAGLGARDQAVRRAAVNNNGSSSAAVSGAAARTSSWAASTAAGGQEEALR